MSVTRIPSGASSTRSASVSARNANFDALYGAMNGIARRPAIEPTNTSRPRAARSCGRNACVTASDPNTLTSKACRTDASGSTSSGPPTAIPALLTSAASGNPLAPTAAAAAAI